jgi:hypothetical protein
VNRLRHVVGLVLLVLWVPLTSHCTWENLADLALFKCPASAEQQSSDCADDACAQLETATYRNTVAQPDLAPPPFPVLFELPNLILPATLMCVAKAATPPEISSGWQFAFRTALPPRAPSFVS